MNSGMPLARRKPEAGEKSWNTSQTTDIYYVRAVAELSSRGPELPVASL